MKPSLKIRPSMRTSWRKCPRHLYIRWVAGVEPARGRKALVIGTAYHAGLEAYRLGQTPAEAAARAIATYTIQCAEEKLDFDLTTASQISAYVFGYALRFAKDDSGIKVVEAKVFDDGDPEGGTADCVIRYPDGSVWLVEDKTTSRFDPEDAMKMALLRNDQLTTYIAALCKRGVRVEGALYRQVLKTQTRRTQKENDADYTKRIHGIYEEERFEKFREIRLVWTDEQLAAARAESHAVSRAIRRTVAKPLEKWPSNPLSCLGPYGPCEYLKLCATGKDPFREFKAAKEGSHDDGSYQRKIWSQIASPGESEGGAARSLDDIF